MDVLLSLQQPEAYPHAVKKPIQIIETHISTVLLTGTYAYKILKPVNFGFLDFSSLEKRKENLEKEMQHNSLFSPDLYKKVVPLYQKDNRLSLVHQQATIVEYALQMKQLPQTSLLSHQLREQKVTTQNILNIGKRLLAFYEIAPCNAEINTYGSPGIIEHNWQENFEQTQSMIPQILSHQQYKHIQQKIKHFLQSSLSLFAQRQNQKQIKHCHGDLHCENIFLVDGEPYIFDAIVFNKRFPYCDMANDIAFLIMDLTFQGKPQFSITLKDLIVQQLHDPSFEKILPFYVCYAAYVKGKVTGFQCQDNPQLIEKAQRYFALSNEYATLL